jgi:hypothetical protein
MDWRITQGIPPLENLARSVFEVVLLLSEESKTCKCEDCTSARLFGLVVALQIVYLISTVDRGIGAALYLKLEETLRR